jgi:glutamate-1-semialdehyde aminotransferase
MGKGTYAFSWVVGVVMMFFGAAFIATGLESNVFVGPDMMIVGFIMVGGGILAVWLGKRTMRKDVARYTAREWEQFHFGQGGGVSN